MVRAILMTAPYDGLHDLARQAVAVRGHAPSPLPSFWAMTDPDRTPDIIGLAKRLPAGSGLIYRHFGAQDRHETAACLVDIAAERGILILIGNDPELARITGADGVHWSERSIGQLHHRRARGDLRVFTAAAHSPAALRRAAAAGADAVFYSPVFASLSPSAGRPKGHLAASALARSTQTQIIALGGVNNRSAKRLKGLGFFGIASVGAAART
jgi:thiamine-phosphate pyrophosphorylase